MSKIVDRILDFLELFARQQRPLSLSEISRLLSIPVSSCHDVLQALTERGYIYELSPRGGYYPTLRLYGMVHRIAQADPVSLRVEAALQHFRDEMDETVVLAQINGLEATYLLVFEPAHPLVFRQNVGDRVSSLYASSGGKALLGTLDEAALDAAMTSISFKPLTAYTVASEGELRQQIERGRARGWYVNQEETLEGVTTVSATFAWHASNYIVTVAGPSSRVTPKLDATGRALALLMEQLAAGSAQK